MQANRQEQMSEEEAAITPYYNNFFNTYRLGPEDIISVDVFNQPRYSRANITIPPSGRISLALIPGGVFVNGKTVEKWPRSSRRNTTSTSSIHRSRSRSTKRRRTVTASLAT